MRERIGAWYRSLNLANKLFLNYLWVVLLGIATMGVSAFLLLGNSQHGYLQETGRRQVDAVADAISYNLRLGLRIEDIFYTDNSVNEVLSRQYTSDLQIWEAYVVGGFIDHLRQLRSVNPEVASVSYFVANQTLARYDDLVIPVRTLAEIPDYARLADTGSTTHIWLDSQEPRTVVFDRLYFRLGSAQVETQPIGLLRLRISVDRIFSSLVALGEPWILLWAEDENHRLIRGTLAHESKEYPKSAYSRTLAEAPWTINSAVPAANLLESLPDASPILLIVALASLAALAAASQRMARNFSRRLQRQVAHAAQIEAGNFTSQIDDPVADEIGELSHRLDGLSVRIDELLRENFQRGMLQKSSELKALQAQINPHLLYNTLATVSWMARDIEANEIAEVVDSLIVFFRHSLNRGEEMISVEEELEQVRAYLRIQQFRFKAERFVYQIEAVPSAMRIMVPKLVLQPFVENAILHGLEGLGRPATIIIRCRLDSERLTIEVEDDGIGIPPSLIDSLNQGEATSRGYGVSNVRQRLALRYGSGAVCLLSARPGGGTRVTLEIPVE